MLIKWMNVNRTIKLVHHPLSQQCHHKFQLHQILQTLVTDSICNIITLEQFYYYDISLFFFCTILYAIGFVYFPCQHYVKGQFIKKKYFVVSSQYQPESQAFCTTIFPFVMSVIISYGKFAFTKGQNTLGDISCCSNMLQ